MSLILLLVGPALADRVYWVGTPSDEDRAAVARTVADSTMAPIQDLMQLGPLQAADPDAITRLSTELTAVRPLADEFDGELQIMSRLQKATADVVQLNSPEERDLLEEALLFCGFAVHRYFQDKLGTDPGAAPYRTGDGASALVRAWLEAATLYGAPPPDDRGIPEPAQRLAYDNLRAYMVGMPAATFVVGGLAAGASVRVDGVLVSGASARVTVSPGTHYWHVQVGDTVLLREKRKVEAGETITIQAPVGPSELATLTGLVESGAVGWSVPASIMTSLQALNEPVYVATPGSREPTLIRLDSGTATAVRLAADPSATVGLQLTAAVGGGWSSSGDWFLTNVSDGAPYTNQTVNAATPVLSVGLGWRSTWFAAGAGADVGIPTGDWHQFPSGETQVRTLAYPHAAVGLPWLQATVGPLFPWYLGIGGRAHIPIVGPLELTGGGIYGIGISRPRDEGPAFEPLPLYLAWGGVGYSQIF